LGSRVERLLGQEPTNVANIVHQGVAGSTCACDQGDEYGLIDGCHGGKERGRRYGVHDQQYPPATDGTLAFLCPDHRISELGLYWSAGCAVPKLARRPKITVSADGQGLVSQAGALLLAEGARVTGLGEGLSVGLARWRAARAVHDPGKILTDLAVALALGGDCLADAAVLRHQPGLCGPVASDPVISRLIMALAADAPRALRASRKARAAARERAWALAGDRAPGGAPRRRLDAPYDARDTRQLRLPP
jgi:hypothetical protein